MYLVGGHARCRVVVLRLVGHAVVHLGRSHVGRAGLRVRQRRATRGAGRVGITHGAISRVEGRGHAAAAAAGARLEVRRESLTSIKRRVSRVVGRVATATSALGSEVGPGSTAHVTLLRDGGLAADMGTGLRSQGSRVLRRGSLSHVTLCTDYR